MKARGAAIVFPTRTMNQKLFDGTLGFAGGVMIATSFWSLLSPALSIDVNGSIPTWVPVAVVFLFGGIFLWGIDKIVPHLHPNSPLEEAEGIHPGKKASEHSSCSSHNITQHTRRACDWGCIWCRRSWFPVCFLGRSHRFSDWHWYSKFS